MPQTYQIMFDRIWAMEPINTKIYFHPSNNKVVRIFCMYNILHQQYNLDTINVFSNAPRAVQRTILCVYHIIQFQKYSYWCSAINCYVLYFVYNLCGTQLWHNKFYFKIHNRQCQNSYNFLMFPVTYNAVNRIICKKKKELKTGA